MLDGTRTVPGETGLARAKVTRTSLTLRVPDARGHFLPIIAAAPDLPGSARRSAFYSSTTSSSCFRRRTGLWNAISANQEVGKVRVSGPRAASEWRAARAPAAARIGVPVDTALGIATRCG